MKNSLFYILSFIFLVPVPVYIDAMAERTKESGFVVLVMFILGGILAKGRDDWPVMRRVLLPFALVVADVIVSMPMLFLIAFTVGNFREIGALSYGVSGFLIIIVTKIIFNKSKAHNAGGAEAPQNING